MRMVGWIFALAIGSGCGFSNSGEPAPDSALIVHYVFADGWNLSFEVSHLEDYTYLQFDPFFERRGHLTFQELRDLLVDVSPSVLRPLASQAREVGL